LFRNLKMTDYIYLYFIFNLLISFFILFLLSFLSLMDLPKREDSKNISEIWWKRILRDIYMYVLSYLQISKINF